MAVISGSPEMAQLLRRLTMSEYIDWKTYQVLYHKYLWRRDPTTLFDCAILCSMPEGKRLEGKKILDIGAGNCRLTAAAFEEGASSVHVIEPCLKMINPKNLLLSPYNMKIIGDYIEDNRFSDDDRLHIYGMEALLAFSLPDHPRDVDYAFSQQAANEWMNDLAVAGLAEWMKKDGVFVFTTFNKKPSETPHVKQYWDAGREYVEVSYLRDGWVVEHVQCCTGYIPHTTRFRWIAPEKFDEMLSPFFNVYRFRSEKTDMYRCVRM